MKYLHILLAALILPLTVRAQHESQTEYNMLRMPQSAHVVALGGDNITLIEDDASLIFSNPALLSNVASKTIGLNYMNYMAGINVLSATYDFAVMERGTVAVSAQYMSYGSMKETDTEGNILGTFNAKDLAFAGYFSYLLNDYFSAGITAKLITSYIASYNSIGIGVDLGINFFDPRTEWSVSAVVKNLGGQVKAFDETYEPMPIDIQVGVSKRLIHTPIRLNLTFVDLNHLKYKFFHHVVIGADLILPYNIWLGAGYSFRRASDMKIGPSDSESAHGAGWSVGAGINLDRFGVNFAWAKYHLTGSNLMVNLSFRL